MRKSENKISNCVRAYLYVKGIMVYGANENISTSKATTKCLAQNSYGVVIGDPPSLTGGGNGNGDGCGSFTS